MTQLQSRQVVIDGVGSPVLIGGTGVTTEAVVFVHGNPGAGSDWESLMNLVGEFATVVAPDLPGFGGADSSANRDYTLSTYAAHLGAVIDQLGMSTVHLVAHDFGGPFALAWAAANPDRIASVTLINTGLLLDYKWHRLARVWRTPLAGELLMRSTTRSVARLLVRHDNPGLPEKWVNRIVEHLLPDATKRAVLRLYRSTNAADMDALIEPLRRGDPDVLVVFGAADVYIPVAQAERQRRVFPGARIEILPGVGHWAWLEQPDRVAGLVVPFLRERVGASVQKSIKQRELR